MINGTRGKLSGISFSVCMLARYSYAAVKVAFLKYFLLPTTSGSLFVSGALQGTTLPQRIKTCRKTKPQTFTE